MNPLYEFEDIEDYVQNRMSASDRAAFEAALETDPDLFRRVEALQSESKVLRLLRNEHLLAQLETWSEDGEAEKKTDEPAGGSKGSFLYRNWGIIAFAVVFLGGLIVMVKYSNFSTAPSDEGSTPSTPVVKKDTSSTAPIVPNEPVAVEKGPPVQVPNVQKQQSNQDFAAIAASSYMDEDFSQTLMGTDEEESKMLYDQAVRLYGAKKYREALKLLEKPAKNREHESLYLRGYTYYHLGQYAKAEADFRKFRGYDDSDRKLDAIWCEVFCLTKQLPGSRARLDAVLKEITAKPKHPYYDRARALEMALQK